MLKFTFSFLQLEKFEKSKPRRKVRKQLTWTPQIRKTATSSTPTPDTNTNNESIHSPQLELAQHIQVQDTPGTTQYDRDHQGAAEALLNLFNPDKEDPVCIQVEKNI